MRNVHFGIHFGVVSRAQGMTALRRAAYQAGGQACDTNGKVHTYILEADEGRGEWILRPRDAPEWNSQMIWAAAADAERQINSQEARILDNQIPRGVCPDHIPDFVSAVYGIFARAGLVVQVNCHCVTAADGKPNLHLHGLISTRRLTAVGFAAKKERRWNSVFHADGGRAIRARLARAFNRRLESLGYEIRVDPRPNSERGLSVPDTRVPRWVFRSESPTAKKIREALAERRALREQLDAAERDLAIAEAELSEIVRELRCFGEGADEAILADGGPGSATAPSAEVLDGAEAQRLRRAQREYNGRLDPTTIPIGEIERGLSPEQARAVLDDPQTGAGARRIAEAYLRDPRGWDVVAYDMDLWDLYVARLQLLAPIIVTRRSPAPLIEGHAPTPAKERQTDHCSSDGEIQVYRAPSSGW